MEYANRSDSEDSRPHESHQKGSVRYYLRCLGLKYTVSQNSRYGKVCFDEVRVKELVATVISIKVELPPDRGAEKSKRQEFLTQNANKILDTHGQVVWGEHQTSDWLWNASDGVEEYTKDLVFENEGDRQVYAIFPITFSWQSSDTDYRLEKNIKLWIIAAAHHSVLTKMIPTKKRLYRPRLNLTCQSHLSRPLGMRR
jgi:hypothetical protein